MCKNSVERFEEQEWNKLAEEFIAKHLTKWEKFVNDKYFDSLPDEPPEYDDDWHPEDEKEG